MQNYIDLHNLDLSFAYCQHLREFLVIICSTLQRTNWWWEITIFENEPVYVIYGKMMILLLDEMRGFDEFQGQLI